MLLPGNITKLKKILEHKGVPVCHTNIDEKYKGYI